MGSVSQAPTSDAPLTFDERFWKVVHVLGEALKQHDRDDPDWFGLSVLRLATEAVMFLRGTIEAATDPEALWEDPSIEVHYPVEWDWEDWGAVSSTVSERGLQDTESAAQKLSEVFDRHQNLYVFQVLTKRCAYLKRGDDYLQLLPPNLHKVLGRLPEAEQEATLAKLYKPFTVGGSPWHVNDDEVRTAPTKESINAANFTDKDFRELGRDLKDWETKHKEVPEIGFKVEVDGEPFSGSLQIAFHPLVIDEDRRVAFYPLDVGLRFDSDGSTLTTWTAETRVRIWNSLVESLETALQTAGAAAPDSAPPTPDTARATALPEPIVAPKRTFPLAFGQTIADRSALDFVQQAHRIRLPRQRWAALPSWKELNDREVRRILDEDGDRAFQNLRTETAAPEVAAKEQQPVAPRRLRLKASRNVGLSATVSALALIMRLPMERFMAQKGMSPQRMNPARRGSSRTTVRTSCVGAML